MKVVITGIKAVITKEVTSTATFQKCRRSGVLVKKVFFPDLTRQITVKRSALLLIEKNIAFRNFSI